MVLFNYSTKELTAKIVYYGPGLCGKTTNLQFIYESLPATINKGKMLSLATKTDRTLFFDFLPIDLGSIRGMRTRLQLYTVPGQVFYNTTRKLVLKGADGVVFVADSQKTMLEANLESFKNLEQNLADHDMDLGRTPMVIQFNKRDLNEVLAVEELNEAINKFNSPIYEAVATTGIGVHETLKGITRLVLNSLKDRYADKREQRSERAAQAASAALAKAEAASAPEPKASSQPGSTWLGDPEAPQAPPAEAPESFASLSAEVMDSPPSLPVMPPSMDEALDLQEEPDLVEAADELELPAPDESIFDEDLPPLETAETSGDELEEAAPIGVMEEDNSEAIPTLESLAEPSAGDGIGDTGDEDPLLGAEFEAAPGLDQTGEPAPQDPAYDEPLELAGETGETTDEIFELVSEPGDEGVLELMDDEGSGAAGLDREASHVDPLSGGAADLEIDAPADQEPEQYSSLDLDSTIQASPFNMGADEIGQESEVSSIEEDIEEIEAPGSIEADGQVAQAAPSFEEDFPAPMDALEIEPEEEVFSEPSREMFGEDRSHLDLGPEPEAIGIESGSIEAAGMPPAEAPREEAAVIDLGGLQAGTQQIDLPISLEVGGKRIEFKLKVSLDLDSMSAGASERVTSEEGTPS